MGLLRRVSRRLFKRDMRALGDAKREAEAIAVIAVNVPCGAVHTPDIQCAKCAPDLGPGEYACHPAFMLERVAIARDIYYGRS